MVYERTCKNCNNIITYKSKYSYQKAQQTDAKCKTCTGHFNGSNNKGNRHSNQSIQRIRSASITRNEKKKTGKDVRCLECATVFYKAEWQLNQTARHYCSRECANRGHAKFLSKHTLDRLKCAYCNQTFNQSKPSQKYCSTACNSRSNLKTINSKEPRKSKTRPELAFKEMLEFNDIEFVFQKWVSWKRGWKKWYDFYIPSLNLLIEIDGVYWHGKGVETGNLNKQQWRTRLNDRLKTILAKSRGFNLLRIWSDEVNTLNLKETLQRYEQAVSGD